VQHRWLTDTLKDVDLVITPTVAITPPTIALGFALPLNFTAFSNAKRRICCSRLFIKI